jgi:hypothetical protein
MVPAHIDSDQRLREASPCAAIFQRVLASVGAIAHRGPVRRMAWCPPRAPIVAITIRGSWNCAVAFALLVLRLASDIKTLLST